MLQKTIGLMAHSPSRYSWGELMSVQRWRRREFARTILVLATIAFVFFPSYGKAITIGSNSNSLKPFLGGAYDNLRTMLADPTKEFPLGPFSFLPAIGSITVEGLTGTNIFFLAEPDGLSTPEGLTSDERTALKSFVLGGGALALVSDTPPDIGIGGMLSELDGSSFSGSLGGPPGNAEGAIVGTGLSTNGPFGAVQGTFGVSIYSVVVPGNCSTVIGNGGEGPILTEMLPNCLGPGSGAVIAMGDVLFSDACDPTTDVSCFFLNPNNDLLALNWFAQAAGPHGTPEGTPVPEPSSLCLLGVGLALAGRRLHRVFFSKK